jgi:hypothetical protein
MDFHAYQLHVKLALFLMDFSVSVLLEHFIQPSNVNLANFQTVYNAMTKNVLIVKKVILLTIMNVKNVVQIVNFAVNLHVFHVMINLY